MPSESKIQNRLFVLTNRPFLSHPFQLVSARVSDVVDVAVGVHLPLAAAIAGPDSDGDGLNLSTTLLNSSIHLRSQAHAVAALQKKPLLGRRRRRRWRRRVGLPRPPEAAILCLGGNAGGGILGGLALGLVVGGVPGLGPLDDGLQQLRVLRCNILIWGEGGGWGGVERRGGVGVEREDRCEKGAEVRRNEGISSEMTKR